MVGGGPVPAGSLPALETPQSPVGGPHLSAHLTHHSSAVPGSGPEAVGAAAPSALIPLPEGVAWTPTHNGGCDVQGPRYHLLTADLRDIAAVQASAR